MATITEAELRAMVIDPLYAALVDELVALGLRVDKLEQGEDSTSGAAPTRILTSRGYPYTISFPDGLKITVERARS